MGLLSFLFGKSGPVIYEIVVPRNEESYQTRTGEWEPLANQDIAQSGDCYDDAMGRVHIRVVVNNPAQLRAWAARQLHTPELRRVDSLYLSDETREGGT